MTFLTARKLSDVTIRITSVNDDGEVTFEAIDAAMAPGKDSSPLADEAPYEERCAAWDEWRNKYAHCILAMLHGFEALIDRDDEPTGALLDRLRAAEAEVERLRHDIERHIAIASEHATEIERLRDELAECRSKPQELHLHATGDPIDCRTEGACLLLRLRCIDCRIAGVFRVKNEAFACHPISAGKEGE